MAHSPLCCKDFHILNGTKNLSSILLSFLPPRRVLDIQKYSHLQAFVQECVCVVWLVMPLWFSPDLGSMERSPGHMGRSSGVT